jgi:hypothetical protein
MARARGANISVPLAIAASYGAIPASGFRAVAVSSIDIGDDQDVLADDTIGRGRNPQDGGLGPVNNSGQAVVGVDLRYIGLWLRLLLGDPATVAGVKATGSALFGALPANNSTITPNGTDVTFVTGTPTGSQVKVAATIAETLANLVAFLNASADANIAAAEYRADLDGTSLLIRHKTPGTAGNSFTLARSTSPASGLTLSGATLSGGAASGAYNHTFTGGQISHPDAAIEVGHPEVPAYFMNRGVMVNTGAFAMSRQGLNNATFGLIAQKETFDTATMAGTLEDEWEWERLSQFTGVVEMDGVPVARIESASLNIANNLDIDDTIRPDGAIGGADPGQLGVEVSLTVRFADTVMQEKAEAGTAVTLRMGWEKSATKRLHFVMENVKLPRRKRGVSGPGGIRITYPARAFEKLATQRALRAELVNDVASY